MMRVAGRLAGFAFLLPVAFAAWGEIPLAERRSGYEMMTPQTRAIQDDDAANPAMLWVIEGQAIWGARPDPASKSCADCHGSASASMKGVAARYPAFDTATARPIDLEERINRCRTGQQHASAFAFESRQLLAITAYVARQSRGMPIAIETGPRIEPFLAAGREEFTRRRGQLNLACSQCHDDNWGKSLGGSVIPQAHPTGYPIYRLEWQSVGSLQRRLRSCISGVRSEPYGYGAPELVNLELYLMWRARGMPVESPAVRP
ncbi:MAG: sulfur oxidation c-type cytochrome SoxA [Burkholderiaceae bacterium]|nr:sulfur oxidation c-type cytochrome SoxA [Burkholderiaceae bacterium]